MNTDTLRPVAEIPNEDGFALVVAMKDGSERVARVYKDSKGVHRVSNVSIPTDMVGWRRYVPTAEQLHMLRSIVFYLVNEHHVCHSGALIHGRAHERDEDTLSALGTVGFIETDLCSCCEQATCHTVTDAGWRALGFGSCLDPDHNLKGTAT